MSEVLIYVYMNYKVWDNIYILREILKTQNKTKELWD